MKAADVRKVKPKQLVTANIVRVNFGPDPQNQGAPQFGLLLHVPSQSIMISLVDEKRLSAWAQDKAIERTLLPSPERLEWVVGEIGLESELVELYARLLPMHLRLRDNILRREEFKG